MWIRLNKNVVAEIIPEYASPPNGWFPKSFCQHCIETSQKVEAGYTYDSETGLFSPPQVTEDSEEIE